MTLGRFLRVNVVGSTGCNRPLFWCHIFGLVEKYHDKYGIMWKNRVVKVVGCYLAGWTEETTKPLDDASRYSHPYLNPTLTETVVTTQSIAKDCEKSSSRKEELEKEGETSIFNPPSRRLLQRHVDWLAKKSEFCFFFNFASLALRATTWCEENNWETCFQDGVGSFSSHQTTMIVTFSGRTTWSNKRWLKKHDRRLKACELFMLRIRNRGESVCC